MMKTLPEIDCKVLTALRAKSAPVAIQKLADELGIDQSKVTATCMALSDQSLLRIEERVDKELRFGARGRALKEGVLPEITIAKALAEAGKAVDITELPKLTGLEQKEIGQSLRSIEAGGWAKKEGKTLTPTKDLLETRAPESAANALTTYLWGVTRGDAASWVPDAKVRSEVKGYDEARQQLSTRSGIVEEKERKTRLVALTDAGRALIAGGIETRREVNQLTSELLLEGGWRGVDLRPYDVTLPSEPVYPGKEHPLVSIFSQTRRVFLELGFEEIASPYVESSFWDFDALFQPQDHPAREMQDTFYIARPGPCRLPDERLVETVRRTHEDGGTTGSVGWRYRWSPDVARRPVLRTHTTASTIRALAQDPRPPRKVFCVGPVFRRETVDYKHLPVFHQVDGIIIDARASFASLLGTLSAFYRKMGFERFQFRPGFFPYTEPSVEVFVWAERKNDWVEMGGAGVFRPEVTLPFGCGVPVLAWGLGLERLALFRYELATISELYRSRLSWLKEAPLCR
jgi:phenylalanyl-tRNA synthetase alpha chain